jgi:hypothetical protein
MERESWLHLLTGTAELANIVLNDSQTKAFIFDTDERLAVLDIEASRKVLHSGETLTVR